MYAFEVDGMTCSGCADSVKRSVQSIDARAAVDVDLASKKVQVSTAVGISEVEAAIVAAGFLVTARSVE